MPTSVNDPDTTSERGSGRFLGPAIAGLALVIAVGVGLALGDGNDPSPAGLPGPQAKVEAHVQRGTGADLAVSYNRDDPVNYPTELNSR